MEKLETGEYRVTIRLPSRAFSWLHDKWEKANREKFHEIAKNDLTYFPDFLGYAVSELVMLKAQKKEPEFV